MKNTIEVLVTLKLSEKALNRIQQVSDRINLTMLSTRDPEEISEELWARTEILYTDRVLPDPVRAPNLRWIQFHSAGVDRYVDHPIIKNTDVVATSMSGVITSQIAEYVLMALLAFGQRLPRLNQYKEHRKWPDEKEKTAGFVPVELRYSTVGILGYGSIGRQVARLLQPFGATVLATKKDVMHPEDTGYTREGMGDPHGDFFHRLYPVEALHSLLRESDFVVLALPLTEATHHLIDRDALNVMKDTAFLVNVGRGDLIDEAALVEALRTKQIAGAALDVFHEEPLPVDSELWGLDNLILSPHISGLSAHLSEETLALFLDNLNRYLSELPLYNRIKSQQGY